MCRNTCLGVSRERFLGLLGQIRPTRGLLSDTFSDACPQRSGRIPTGQEASAVFEIEVSFGEFQIPRFLGARSYMKQTFEAPLSRESSWDTADGKQTEHVSPISGFDAISHYKTSLACRQRCEFVKHGCLGICLLASTAGDAWVTDRGVIPHSECLNTLTVSAPRSLLSFCSKKFSALIFFCFSSPAVIDTFRAKVGVGEVDISPDSVRSPLADLPPEIEIRLRGQFSSLARKHYPQEDLCSQPTALPSVFSNVLLLSQSCLESETQKPPPQSLREKRMEETMAPKILVKRLAILLRPLCTASTLT
ncbi:hypothetical protein QBC44DRAFT_119093 [Cladorrhinum sp. PSN332]|nr:hypothetical protein QBC44DRAFT_119093 [Cladorrhinum sp. PSN332]